MNTYYSAVLYESGAFMLTINNKGWLFTSILSALMAFTSLSTDIYLPAMPEMGRCLLYTSVVFAFKAYKAFFFSRVLATASL